ncbi:hypothetical protein WI645_10925 [Vibrio cholerae]
MSKIDKAMRILLAGFCINLCLGILYAWSVFNKALVAWKLLTWCGRMRCFFFFGAGSRCEGVVLSGNLASRQRLTPLTLRFRKCLTGLLYGFRCANGKPNLPAVMMTLPSDIKSMVDRSTTGASAPDRRR